MQTSWAGNNSFIYERYSESVQVTVFCDISLYIHLYVVICDFVFSAGSVQKRGTKYNPLHYHNDSCPEECRKRMFDAVLFYVDTDRELAEKVKKWLEGLLLCYFGRFHRSRIELLPRLSSESIMENVREACRIATNIILLYTENFKQDQSADKISMKMSTVAVQSRSSTEYAAVIRLTFDDCHETDGLIKTIAYRPRDPQFQDVMQNVLLGRTFDRRLSHDAHRKKCEIKKENSFSKGSKIKRMKPSGQTKKKSAIHQLPETSSDNTSSMSLTDDSGTVNTQGRGLARYSQGKRGEETQSTNTTDCTSDNSRKSNSSGREADVSSADSLSGTRTEQFPQQITQTENHETIPNDRLRQMTDGTSKNPPVQKAVENKWPDGDSASKETNTEKATVDGNTCMSSGSYTKSSNIQMNYDSGLTSSETTPSDEDLTHPTASWKRPINHFNGNQTSSSKANISVKREDSSVSYKTSSSREHGAGFSRSQIKSRTNEKVNIEQKGHKIELDFFRQASHREESYSSSELSSGGNNPVTFDDDGLQNGRQPELPGAPALLLTNRYPEQSEAHQTSLKTFAPVAEAHPDSGPGDDSKQAGARSGMTGQEGGVGAGSSQASDHDSISVVMP